MKKTIVIISMLWGICIFSNAQVKFGVKANTSFNFNTSDIGGYGAGVFMDIPLSEHWLFEPILNFTPIGTKSIETDSKSGSLESVEWDFVKHKPKGKTITVRYTNSTEKTIRNKSAVIDLPLLIGYRYNISSH
jgi:hypothetical protein